MKSSLSAGPLCGPLLRHCSCGTQGSEDLGDTYSQSVRLAVPVPQCHCRRRASLRGGDIACQPGRTKGPPGRPLPPAGTLTVAVREACEALGTRVTPLPREIRPAVAAASQVLTRPICEVRLAVAAWVGTRGQEVMRPRAQGYETNLGSRMRAMARPPRAARAWDTLPGPYLSPGRPPEGPHSRRQAWGESRGVSGAR